MEMGHRILGVWPESPEKAWIMVRGFGHSSGSHCCPPEWCKQGKKSQAWVLHLSGLETLTTSSFGLQFPHLKYQRLRIGLDQHFSQGGLWAAHNSIAGTLVKIQIPEIYPRLTSQAWESALLTLWPKQQ